MYQFKNTTIDNFNNNYNCGKELLADCIVNTLQAQPVLFTVFMRKIYLLIKEVIELHVSMSSRSHNQTDELESMFLMFLGKKKKRKEKHSGVTSWKRIVKKTKAHKIH